MIIAILGCSFESNLYIAFFWSDSEKPDSFSSNIPNVPVDIDSIARGGDIITFPGTYTLEYSYTTLEAYTLPFTLEEDAAFLGRENTYYHIYLRKNTEPYILKYPY